MRVVLDTNILARAIASPTGPAGEVFERIAAEHMLVISSELVEELSRVLAYERVRRMHQRSEAEIEQFIASVESGGRVVSLPHPVPRVVPHDPDDDVPLATAVAGGVDVLCTRNRHLFHEAVVAYCQQNGIEIMDDLQLLVRLRGGDTSRESPSGEK